MNRDVNPLCDVAEDFGRDGFLYLAILIGGTCGAMLEEVVEPGIFFDTVLLRFWQVPLDGGQV